MNVVEKENAVLPNNMPYVMFVCMFVGFFYIII